MQIELFEAFCVICMILIASMISYALGYFKGIEWISMESYHKGKGRTMKEVSDSFKEEPRDE